MVKTRIIRIVYNFAKKSGPLCRKEERIDMSMKKVKYVSGVLAAVLVLGSFSGCGNNSGDNEREVIILETQENNQVAGEESSQGTLAKSDNKQAGNSQSQITAEQPTAQPAVNGDTLEEELDVITPNPEDADWYKKGIVYTSENGHSLEVFYDDEGMLQFAVDGLSLYFTSADNFQVENNWRIYTCDDGTMIVYYPGSPAHVEISSGDYEGLYEAEK